MQMRCGHHRRRHRRRPSASTIVSPALYRSSTFFFVLFFFLVEFLGSRTIPHRSSSSILRRRSCRCGSSPRSSMMASLFFYRIHFDAALSNILNLIQFSYSLWNHQATSTRNRGGWFHFTPIRGSFQFVSKKNKNNLFIA